MDIYPVDIFRVENLNISFNVEESLTRVPQVIGDDAQELGIDEEGLIQTSDKELIMVVEDILEVFDLGQVQFHISPIFLYHLVAQVVDDALDEV